jgi:GrpB-like predicted nucleotidyltransferase (UPF0157 family)
MLFRDYIRENADARDEYIILKKELASQHERITYTQLKAPFIQRILTLARAKKEI